MLIVGVDSYVESAAGFGISRREQGYILRTLTYVWSGCCCCYLLLLQPLLSSSAVSAVAAAVAIVALFSAATHVQRVPVVLPPPVDAALLVRGLLRLAPEVDHPVRAAVGAALGPATPTQGKLPLELGPHRLEPGGDRAGDAEPVAPGQREHLCPRPRRTGVARKRVGTVYVSLRAV